MYWGRSQNTAEADEEQGPRAASDGAHGEEALVRFGFFFS